MTGSTNGIGRAVAVALAAEGVTVVVSGRSKERGEDVVRSIRETGGEAEFVRADLSTVGAAVELAADAARALGGHVDILVNNAGTAVAGATADYSEEQFDRIYDLNVKAPFFLTGALAPGMAERGSGAVINIGSTVALYGMPVSSLYGSTKAALELLTRAWTTEFGPSGVRVNSVSPGPTRTELAMSVGREHIAALTAGLPAARPAEPEEVAAAVVFLASDEASYLHGARLPLDGGRGAA